MTTEVKIQEREQAITMTTMRDYNDNNLSSTDNMCKIVDATYMIGRIIEE